MYGCELLHHTLQFDRGVTFLLRLAYGVKRSVHLSLRLAYAVVFLLIRLQGHKARAQLAMHIEIQMRNGI